MRREGIFVFSAWAFVAARAFPGTGYGNHGGARIPRGGHIRLLCSFEDILLLVDGGGGGEGGGGRRRRSERVSGEGGRAWRGRAAGERIFGTPAGDGGVTSFRGVCGGDDRDGVGEGSGSGEESSGCGCDVCGGGCVRAEVFSGCVRAGVSKAGRGGGADGGGGFSPAALPYYLGCRLRLVAIAVRQRVARSVREAVEYTTPLDWSITIQER